MRFADGLAAVVDVRPAEQIDDKTAAVFERTAKLCDALGWGYVVVSDISAVEQRNLRFLSGYRFDRRSAEATELLQNCLLKTGAISEWVSRLRGSAPDPLGAVFWGYCHDGPRPQRCTPDAKPWRNRIRTSDRGCSPAAPAGVSWTAARRRPGSATMNRTHLDCCGAMDDARGMDTHRGTICAYAVR
ncbi:hypothetical protein GCM10023198_60080 [Promicromonospora umidemergens]|uniref:Uncharacterized protein n=1 Tax=Promicromonospora umidemergens TaxID=629679 RepID=A0ABP8YDA1_9MICO